MRKSSSQVCLGESYKRKAFLSVRGLARLESVTVVGIARVMMILCPVILDYLLLHVASMPLLEFSPTMREMERLRGPAILMTSLGALP